MANLLAMPSGKEGMDSEKLKEEKHWEKAYM
jgi:hypothetical protein